ncbi:Pro-resilin [Portunus trituberculatus]|uniref:Pro-resilin n=1 Tax=Portunus trituberculatus TaxID=210409 RepID=A0A5B7DGP6_PORTR|nr:Pro-resilin [Portunus trituberculatus]
MQQLTALKSGENPSSKSKDKMFTLQVPPKYEYTYDVNDDYRKVKFDKTESRDGYKTAGSYSVHLPDGRKQIVTYADSGDGLEAEVKYEGDIVVDPYHPPKPVHPAHPPPSYPRHPYFPPVYHPQPAAAAVQAAPESEAPVEIAAVEEEDAAPVKIQEEPEEEEEEVEEAVEEEPVVEETSAVEEEEQPVVEIAEVTTLPPQE